jgi:ABC-2 type transport system permease protein
MRILDIALKDLLQIVRDWKAAFFLLVMPILFTLIFGFAFGGFGSLDEQADHRLSVGYVNQDSGKLGDMFFALLDNSAAIRPENLTEDTVLDDWERMVAEDELAAVIVIPAGYSEAIYAGETIQLTTILKADTSAGATAQNGIQAAASRLTNAVAAAIFSTQSYARQTPFDDVVAQQSYFNQALDLAMAAWNDPPLMLDVFQTGQDEDQGVPDNAFAHSSVGMMLQFALAGLISAATVLVMERKSGSLQRLLTTATSRVDILLGHFLAMCLMILIQFAILITFAQVLLDVAYFSAPLATLVMALASTFFAASLGILIGTIAKNEEQVVMLSLIPMFILSGLGGAWVPLEFTSESFQTIGHFTPLAWAMDGFQNIISRGMGLESVWLPAGVLIAYAVLCFVLATWRFRYE